MTKEMLEKANELITKIKRQQIKTDFINENRNNAIRLNVRPVFDKDEKYYPIEDKEIIELILSIVSLHENEKLSNLKEEFFKTINNYVEL